MDEIEEEVEEIQREKEKEVDLEKLVKLPSWKEMLFDLVIKEQLDPWNIDIEEIAERYLERIKKMKTLDLHIPANFILAASILLRFKSDSLRLIEDLEQDVEEETYIEEGMPPVEIPILTITTRIPPKRKVTLKELIRAVEEVFEEQRRREERRKVILPESVVIEVPEEGIEERIGRMLEKVKEKADSEGLVLFSQLLKDGGSEEIIETLIPLLFLAQREKVSLFQEKFFGEIFIQLLENGSEKW